MDRLKLESKKYLVVVEEEKMEKEGAKKKIGIWGALGRFYFEILFI